MKKIFVSVVLACALVGIPAAAQASTAPKPGATCKTSGATVVKKDSTYVCMPTKKWSKGLKKSASSLTTKDTWAKAADSGMTAAFGMITNPTAQDIRIIAVRSPQYTDVAQLHEVVMSGESNEMIMQEKKKGFLIPAGKTVELKPGGDHIMFLKLKKPITAGSMIPITLIGSQGEQLQFTAMAKVYTGANENYEHSGM